MSKKILVIKTSSLGDVLHLLPALSDAKRYNNDIKFHWVVEEAFSEIAGWHESVEKVVPVALRRWRKNPILALTSDELGCFIRSLRANGYEKIIDAQGLLKSALIAFLAHGPVSGFDQHSAREPFARFLYQTPLAIGQHHAVKRLRHLFATALEYPLPDTTADYGLQNRFPKNHADGFVFLHGTTWRSKHWPESYWLELIKLCAPYGKIILPWGNEEEKQRAQRVADVAPTKAFVTKKLNLSQLATLLANSKAVVSVDTGPGHLTAALGTPCISLYGPTDPKRTGTEGDNQYHLQDGCIKIPCLLRTCPMKVDDGIHPPCFRSVSPELVWETLKELI